MPLVEKNLNNWKKDGKVVVLNKEFLIKGNDKTNKWGKFKKITGTRFSAIFGLSKYNSPFKVWMGMVNLFKDEMDETLSTVGNIVELILKQHAEKLLNNKYITYDPKQIGWDAFHENEIFGGIPDGEPLKDGEVDYSSNLPMLEIKTSSIDKLLYKTVGGALKMSKDENGLPIVAKQGEKKKEWFDSNGEITIPIEYQFQLSLYLYLRNINKGMFVVGFLTPQDYVAPQKFECSTHDVRMVEFNLKDRDKFKIYIDKAIRWYKKHIVGGISPEMTNDDEIWLEKEISLLK